MIRSLFNLLFRNNFQCVVPGKVYRSGQLPSAVMLKALRAHKIRSVIDLRRNAGRMDKSGCTEKDLVNHAGAAYFQVKLNAKKIPCRAKVEELLHVFDKAEVPVLIHCSSGTHRTGVSAALWLLEQEKLPFEKASQQLSLRFGYFWPERMWKTLLSPIPTIDYLLWNYSTFVSEHPVSQQTVSFREWLASM